MLAGQSAGAHICLCLIVEDLARRLSLVTATNMNSIKPTATGTVPPQTTNGYPLPVDRAINEDSSSSDSSTPLTSVENDEEQLFSLPTAAAAVTHITLTELLDSNSKNGSQNQRGGGGASSHFFDNSSSSFDYNPIAYDKGILPLALSQPETDQVDDNTDETEDVNESVVFGEVMTPIVTTRTSNGHSHGHSSHGQQHELKQGEDVLGLVKLFVGISGPYDLLSLADHLQERGLDSSILGWICRGDMARYSPASRLKQILLIDDDDGNDSNSYKNSPSNTSSQSGQKERAMWVKRQLPPFALFHGGKDTTIPCHLSRSLHSLLSCDKARLKASYREYVEWSHTDAILEAPLLGTSRLFEDMSAAIEQAVLKGSRARRVSVGSSGDYGGKSMTSGMQPMVPWIAVAIARWVNPF